MKCGYGGSLFVVAAATTLACSGVGNASDPGGARNAGVTNGSASGAGLRAGNTNGPVEGSFHKELDRAKADGSETIDRAHPLVSKPVRADSSETYKLWPTDVGWIVEGPGYPGGGGTIFAPKKGADYDKDKSWAVMQGDWNFVVLASQSDGPTLLLGASGTENPAAARQAKDAGAPSNVFVQLMADGNVVVWGKDGAVDRVLWSFFANCPYGGSSCVPVLPLPSSPPPSPAQPTGDQATYGQACGPSAHNAVCVDETGSSNAQLACCRGGVGTYRCTTFMGSENTWCMTP